MIGGPSAQPAGFAIHESVRRRLGRNSKGSSKEET